jgi:hypothetical protein
MISPRAVLRAGFTLFSALLITSLPARWQIVEAQVNPAAGSESRFAVVHAHAASQCIGYLFVSANRIRYEVAQPETDRKDSFDLARTEITAVGQWILLGVPQNAVEIRTAHGNYHFWLLPDNADVRNTAPRQWNVRNAVPVSPLIAALQGRSEAVASSSTPAAPAPASPTPPARSMPNVAGANSLSEYVYAAPQGWTTNKYPDGIVLTSPVSNTGERCLISMWPMRPAGADLQNDANLAFQTIFNTYELRNRTSDGMSMPQVAIRGRSGQGWDYLILMRGIGNPNGPGGPFETLQGFVMVAKLNSNLAVISGLSKVPLVSSCFGELIADVWPRFFYSLHFKDWPVTDQASAIAAKITGTWTIATSTVADRYQFAANGRYASAAAVQNYNRSSTEVLETTQAFFGDGSYALKENAITLTPDPGHGPTVPGFVRVEEESKDNGRTWVPILYLLRTSTVDGKEYEVRYQKN